MNMLCSTAVDEHLDGYAAVDQQRRRHARRHRRGVDGGAELEVVDIHLPGPEAEEGPRAGVTDVEQLAGAHGDRLPGEEQVRRAADARRRRVDLHPPGRLTVAHAPGVRDANGNEAALIDRQAPAVTVDREDGVAVEDVEALLDRMHVSGDGAAALAQRKSGMDRTDVPADEVGAAMTGAVGGVRP
jgi:hypothetical protein